MCELSINNGSSIFELVDLVASQVFAFITYLKKFTNSVATKEVFAKAYLSFRNDQFTGQWRFVSFGIAVKKENLEEVDHPPDVVRDKRNGRRLKCKWPGISIGSSLGVFGTISSHDFTRCMSATQFVFESENYNSSSIHLWDIMSKRDNDMCIKFLFKNTFYLKV